MVNQDSTRSEVSRLALEAWESLFRAQSTRYREFQASPVWAGRSDREYDVLYTLSRDDDGMRQKDLTDCLLISQPSLSRLVEKLVGEQLVDRQPDPADRRGAILRLTDTGRALQRRIGAGHARDVIREMTARLSPDEMTVLRELTQKLSGPSTASAAGPNKEGSAS